jgi:hypothetical protein
MAEVCAQCGANLALVGRAHRCVPNKVQPVPNKGAAVPNKDDATRVARWKAANGERYRTYMRGLMRARRAQRRGRASA